MVLEIRGIVLPERMERRFWIDDGHLMTDPVPGAEVVVDGGWLLPGLVDVHTHPGTEKPGDIFDEAMLRKHLTDHRDAGVLLVRTPGSAARLPEWAFHEHDLPRVTSAGRWLAPPGRFFPKYGRDVTEEELVSAAVEEAQAASGWCKIIADWLPDQPALDLDLLRTATEAVHAVGGKVAVHCQTADGSRNAVVAGVDSLEHGMHLDPDLLTVMAAQGTALVPTLSAFAPMEGRLRSSEPTPVRDWLLSGWDKQLPLVRAASECGVTILAGTDKIPCGKVSDEVAWLIRAGLPAESAIGAASWTARSWLGLPGLSDGAPADVVAYRDDPAIDPAVLGRPDRIILGGRIVP
jgi:imidazolonepropionase-like amidohydrolase